MQGCVLTVSSSTSAGPSRIRRPMSSPSAVDARRTMSPTTAFAAKPASMPTDWEPCPGKTNATRGVTCFSSTVTS